MPTDTQAGWYQGHSANPLAAAATAETAATAACVRVRSTFIGHAFTNTPLGHMYVTRISTDLACTVTHRTSSIVPELRVQKLRSVQIVTFCVTTRNQLVVHEWLVLNHSAAVHVLTSRTFYTYHTILNCQLHGDPNSLFHDLVVRIELNVPTLLHLLSCANNASGIAVALVKRRYSQSRFS